MCGGDQEGFRKCRAARMRLYIQGDGRVNGCGVSGRIREVVWVWKGCCEGGPLEGVKGVCAYDAVCAARVPVSEDIAWCVGGGRWA